MADALYNLLEQTPATSLAVGGALVAAAVGFTAVKALSGGKSASSSDAANVKKKKKTKAPKKKAGAEVDQTPARQANTSPAIDLDQFVTNDPDTEDEEAARAEKKKLKRKLKKKNANIKAKIASASKLVSSSSEVDVVDRKKAAAAALKKDVDDGWETVKTKKVSKSKLI